MTIYSIYRATNKNTGKVYIGFTSLEVDTRRKQHESNALKRNMKCKFYNSIRKHSAEVWIWDTIYQSKDRKHTLLTMENFFIIAHDSFNRGYNETLGGEGCLGKKLKSKTKQKIKTTLTGVAHTTERKLNNSKAHIGLKQSTATIEKKNASLKQVVHTAEWNENVSLSLQKKRWIHNSTTKERAFVDSDEAEQKLASGWKSGVGPRKNTKVA